MCVCVGAEVELDLYQINVAGGLPHSQHLGAALRRVDAAKGGTASTLKWEGVLGRFRLQ